MKIKFLTISSLFLLNGCQATVPTMKNRISFEMDNQYWPIHSIVYKTIGLNVATYQEHQM